MSLLGPFTRPWQDVLLEGHPSYDLLKYVLYLLLLLFMSLDTTANHYRTCKLRWGLGGGLENLGGTLGNEVASKRLVVLLFPKHIWKNSAIHRFEFCPALKIFTLVRC